MSGINTLVTGLDIDLGEEEVEGDVQGEVAKMKEIVSDLQEEVKGKQDRPIQMGGGIPRRDVTYDTNNVKKVDVTSFSMPRRRRKNSRRTKSGGIVNKENFLVGAKSAYGPVDKTIIGGNKK